MQCPLADRHLDRLSFGSTTRRRVLPKLAPITLPAEVRSTPAAKIKADHVSTFALLRGLPLDEQAVTAHYVKMATSCKASLSPCAKETLQDPDSELPSSSVLIDVEYDVWNLCRSVGRVCGARRCCR